MSFSYEKLSLQRKYQKFNSHQVYTCKHANKRNSVSLLCFCWYVCFCYLFISLRPLIETTLTFQMELISLWAAMITIFTFMNCKMKGSRSRLKHVARLERTIYNDTSKLITIYSVELERFSALWYDNNKSGRACHAAGIKHRGHHRKRLTSASPLSFVVLFLKSFFLFRRIEKFKRFFYESSLAGETKDACIKSVLAAKPVTLKVK